MQWRRGDVGYELGAAAMAAIITLGLLVLAIGAAVLITWPDVEVVAMLVVLGIAAVLLPIVTYPMSYTMWQAVDVVMRPVSSDDFAAVGGVHAGPSGGRSGSVRPDGA